MTELETFEDFKGAQLPSVVIIPLVSTSKWQLEIKLYPAA